MQQKKPPNDRGRQEIITMKKIIAGIGFEITGVMMVLFSTLIASMTLENTSEWNT